MPTRFFRINGPLRIATILAASGMVVTACSRGPDVSEEAGYGATPVLPEPEKSWIPTVKVAKAVGWKDGEQPTPAAGFRLSKFAAGLDHPRWLYELPNGDVLVAESNAPPKPEDKKGGLRAWVQGFFMARAGARVPSANRISLLRDVDGDGIAEFKSAFIERLTSPFGMALVGDQLYVANADAVVRFC